MQRFSRTTNKSINYSNDNDTNKKKVNCDLVGQPNPVSNLRTIKFHIPDNESEIQRLFRIKREEVQKWNEEFWTKHNSNFIKVKCILLFYTDMPNQVFFTIRFKPQITCIYIFVSALCMYFYNILFYKVDF